MDSKDRDSIPKGIVVGLVEVPEKGSEPYIAVGIIGQPVALMPIKYALVLHNQLDMLLDTVGAFGEEESLEDAMQKKMQSKSTH